MDNSSTVNGSVGSSDLISKEEFHNRLSELTVEWGSYHEKGLEIRHKTGKLLNDHYGPPTARQTYGEGVLKEVAGRLRVAESDLSRMRWLAHHFKSVDDLRERFPAATTWTAVKELLPTLNQEGEAKKKTPDNAVKEPLPTPNQDGEAKEETPDDVAKPQKTTEAETSKFDVVKRALADLSLTLREVQQNLSDEEKKDLLEQFKELVKAMEACLKIHVSVGQVSAEEAPPAGKE